jgi:hypothetical protein
VFLTINNDGKKQYLPPGDMKVVDTQGNEYLPIQTSGGGFGLSFTDPIPPGGKAPPPDSPAATGTEGGALVLFRVKEESATDNLPLHLEIQLQRDAPPHGVLHEGERFRHHLDFGASAAVDGSQDPQDDGLAGRSELLGG